MEFLFEDHAFKFETLRAAGLGGEVLLTAAAIPEGDEGACSSLLNVLKCHKYDQLPTNHMSGSNLIHFLVW
jgi:hypothetical protein